MSGINVRKTPILLTGIILEILKAHFSQEEIWKYVDDEASTRIDINPSFKWDPKRTQDRPGIYVKREDIVIGPRLGMDDLYHEDMRTGEKEYAINSNVSWTVFCISPQVGEAEELAMATSDVLIFFSPLLRRDYKFDMFGVTRIGAVGKMDESREFWLVPVQVEGKFNEVWPITPEALKIQSINLKVDYKL